MRKGLDLPLIASVLALGAISLLTIFAANRTLALDQTVFWILGLAILYMASHVHYENWQKLALPFYLLSVVALFSVFPLGESVRGAVRWIDLGVFRFQPSEIAKVATILLLGIFFLKRSAAEIKNVLLSLLIVL